MIKSFGAVDFRIHNNVLNYVAILQKLYMKMNNNVISKDKSTQLYVFIDFLYFRESLDMFQLPNDADCSVSAT